MDHYSHSQLALYESCPLAYHRRYVEGRTPERSPAAAIGSAAHAAAAAYIEHLVSERLSTDVTWDPIPAARERMAEEGIRLPAEAWEEVEGLIEALKRSFTMDPVHYLEHEKRTELEVAGRDWVGVIDLVTAEDGFVITDWKTDWAVRSQSEVERDQQLRRYAWMLHRLYGCEAVRARLWFLRHGVAREIALGLEDFERTEKGIISTIEAIENEQDWTPTPGVGCAWCSWSEECPAVSDLPLAIVTPDDAARIAGELAILEKQVKDRKEALKSWCVVNGPIVAGGLAWGHWESRTPRVTDIRAFIERVGERAYDMLTVDGRKLGALLKTADGELDGLIEEAVSTSFRSRKA
jgi:CRISPR/Cas system-associated exonuclease Cas4 (RecB family)